MSNDLNILLANYIDSLIGKFYKILPIKESNESTLLSYVESFQRELIGCKNAMKKLSYDSRYMTLIAILSYIKDNIDDVQKIRSDVFRAIDICKKLKEQYAKGL